MTTRTILCGCFYKLGVLIAFGLLNYKSPTSWGLVENSHVGVNHDYAK